MPRTRGHNGQAVRERNSAETVSFNIRFDKDDLELLLLVLSQGKQNIDWPPEWLENAIEIAERMEKRNKETRDELKGNHDKTN